MQDAIRADSARRCGRTLAGTFSGAGQQIERKTTVAEHAARQQCAARPDAVSLRPAESPRRNAHTRARLPPNAIAGASDQNNAVLQ